MKRPPMRIASSADRYLNSREGFNNPSGSTSSRVLRDDRRMRRKRRMKLRKLRGWH